MPSFDTPPKNISLSIKIRVDGGSLSNDEIGAAAVNILRAFEGTARKFGLESCHVVELSALTPKQYAAWYRREFKRELATASPGTAKTGD